MEEEQLVIINRLKSNEEDPLRIAAEDVREQEIEVEPTDIVKVEMEEEGFIKEEQVFFEEEPINNQEISQEILDYCPQQNSQKETTIREVPSMPKSVSYCCDICWKEFTDIKSLKSHMLSHETAEDVIFMQDMEAGSIDRVKQEMEVEPTDVVKVEMKEEVCIEEEQVFFEEEPINNVEISQEILDYCPQQNTQKETTLREVPTMPKSVSYFCDICWKEFTDIKSLKSHILSHETAEDVRLKQDMEAGSIDRVKQEMEVEPIDVVKVQLMGDEVCIEEEPIDNQEISQEILVYCPQQNTQKETTKREVPTMPKSVSYFCDICWKEFTDMVSLKSHIVYHEENRCEICDKKFDRKGGLSIHMSSHSKKQIFRCLTCNEKFSIMFSLTKHLNVHKEKKCGCELCGKKFTHPSVLKTHMDTHPEYGQLKCVKCGQKFNRNTLKIHMRTDHGETLYGCIACGAKFSSRASLMKHTSTHRNTPFVCGICAETFDQNQSLKSHLLTHE